MPRAVITVPVSYENFTRPVALQVIREVARVLHLPDNLDITFAGGAEQQANTGSTLNKDPNDSQFASDLRMRVEVQERPVEDRMITLHSNEPEHYPVFNDPALKVAIYPIFSLTEMMVSFTVRFNSRVSAQKFRDDCLIRLGMLRREDNHELTYHYSIPNPFMHLLRDIHTLRESQAPYGEDFSTWMNNHLDPRATILTNVAGSRTLLAFPETQTRIWGTFSDITANTEGATKEKDTGTWTLSFDYRVQYDKPLACRAEWPLVVHNQFINEPWFHQPVASGRLVDRWNRNERPSPLQHAMDVIATDEPTRCSTKYKMVTIPSIDDWTTDHRLPDLLPLVQMLIGVDPAEPHVVQDLKALEDFEWDPDILEFMRGEAPYMTRYGHSIFHVTLYRDKTPQQFDTLSVTDELAVVSTNPLNLRENHHLRVNVLTDLFFLTTEARNRLLESGATGQKLLMQLQFMQAYNAYRPELVNGKLIRLADFRVIAELLNSHKRQYSGTREALMLTVGTYTIVTRRKPDGNSEANVEDPTDTGAHRGPNSGQFVSRCNG